MKTYITYNAGCNIWEIMPFDLSIDWHGTEFQGTFKDCKKYAGSQMKPSLPHYPNAEYESIYDY